MSILDTIVVRKKAEVAERKERQTINTLEKSSLFDRPTYSLSQALRQTTPGIIAEFKRKSPSKGIINDQAGVSDTTRGYIKAGAAALSVLTDIDFFNGSDENLQIAREQNVAPILRKDFTIDEYQITEAKAIGADAILLIAAILPPPRVLALAQHAHRLGLEVLLEVHNETELQQTALNDLIAPFIDVVGVNNRDLNTFHTTIETSIQLAQLMPKEIVKISESGINDPANIRTLMDHGYEGFLIGEYFMKQSNPAQACQEFIQEVNALSV
uniref:Indole-3-glycerol phosphate synthase n=1 Tax=Roseihalotalea indica TaxID=2867963 RepID=A0AA49GIY0_9BACT|nr:indole-3-glycerol phosphate synthase TrpC [Tunicatimonas sp. TK19036]